MSVSLGQLCLEHTTEVTTEVTTDVTTEVG